MKWHSFPCCMGSAGELVNVYIHTQEPGTGLFAGHIFSLRKNRTGLLKMLQVHGFKSSEVLHLCSQRALQAEAVLNLYVRGLLFIVADILLAPNAIMGCQRTFERTHLTYSYVAY